MRILSLLQQALILMDLVTTLEATPTPSSPPMVDLGYSKYQGTSFNSGVSQYLGIRYAAPPLGELRFRAPAKPLNVTGTQLATAFQPICLGISVVLPSSSQSEDCLFANVWTPTSATPQSKLPVWVFIQGGGYISDANANYNGSTVVETSGGNIVFVNFNYRVSAWGFLASEKVRTGGDLNAGLLDQRELLKWVQKYIALFGGDPDHVVIHGASAGAGSVALHLSAYGGRDDGLFVGAIGESVFFPTQPKVDEVEWQFERFVNATGCFGFSDELGCLRSKDTATLQAANIPSPLPGQNGHPLFYWTPTIDGNFIQQYPYLAFEQGKFVKVPIMFGDDTNEGSSFAANASSPAQVATFFTENYPYLTQSNTDAINTEYPLMAPIPLHAAYFPSASAAYGESTFTCPGLLISNALATSLSPYKVWNYRYNVHSAVFDALGKGVYHTFEIPAIFGLGNGGDSPDQDLEAGYTTYNADIVPVVMNYWISFVRALSPNRYKYDGASYWESFGDGKNGGRRLVLQSNGSESVMEVVPAEQVERCEFWKGLALVMEQ